MVDVFNTLRHYGVHKQPARCGLQARPLFVIQTESDSWHGEALYRLRGTHGAFINRPTGLGDKLSQQGVPPDEHQWIEERHGVTPVFTRDYRNRVRDY